MKYTILLVLSLTGCGAEDANNGQIMKAVNQKEEPDSRGPQGERGEKGEKGEKGDKGDQGTIGATGSTGAQGTAGSSAQTFDVFDQNNALVGQLYGVNWASNLYYVVNAHNDRFEIDQTNGTFPYAYIVFSGLNCTGTKRLLLTNGKFANVYVDGTDSSLVRMTGQNLGAFNYQSRIPAATNCQNATGSTTNSYAAATYTATFSYPLGRLDVEN